MTSGTVSSLFVLLLSCSPAWAQSQTANAQFNQVLNINGDMKINSFTFPDRSRVETFSQKQQQLIVNQNTPAIPPNQVTGSTGQPFVALMAQSMSINTNNASSLVGGQIELVMDPQMLQNAAVNPDNTFVAKLSPDRQTWMIQETMRSVNITDKTVRMVKRQNLDGEYMALGRQTIETNAFLTGFGTDPSTQVAVQGTGLQENEFQDGFRMSVRATQPMTMNVDVKQGVDSSQLTALQGQQSVNNFRYSVVTNLAGVQPNLNRQVTVVQMPLNAARIQSMMQSAGVQQGGQVQLSVAQRGILQNPGGATGQLTGPITPQRRGREAFREDVVARQVQGATGQTGTGQTGTGQTTTGQTGTGQTGTGQITTGQTGTGQTTTGQTGTGQTTNGQTGTGTGTTGTGTNQQGTGTTNNNPAATQLLLAPTFTPIQAQLVLDPVNMRVAFPVAAVDGEYIITMQTGGAQPQAQGQGQGQGQAPPQPQAGQQPQAQGQEPQGQTPPTAEPQGQRGNGTAPAGEKPREKRQSSSNKAPLGSVFIQMDWINQMVELDQWGGQVAITKMMDEYVKAGGNSNGTKTN